MSFLTKVLTGVTFLTLCAPVWADSPAKPTYDKMCASCHGPDGKGNADKAKSLKLDPGILNLGRAEGAKTKAEMQEMIVKGKNKMPSYEKKLKGDEAAQLADYVMELVTAIRGK